MTIILMILMMCVLIVPHEFGHFITAKLCGVQVNEFSVGMGPLIFQRQRGETMYSLRLIPFGGFCALEGENGDEEDDDYSSTPHVDDNPRSFGNKSAKVKLLVLFAGAAMNILIAVIIMSAITTYEGYPINKIDTVVDNSPAMVAGIESGDVIKSVNGTDVRSWSETITAISSVEEGDKIAITVSREGEEKSFEVVPVKNEQGNYVIGVVATMSHNVFACTWIGMKVTWNLNATMIDSFRQLFTRGVGKDDVAGPVGMASVVHEYAKAGIINYIFLLAVISLNLAIINLLPFPALDGGRILFVIIRKITGGVITDKIESYVHAFGMIILILLFVLVTWNDITRLFMR